MTGYDWSVPEADVFARMRDLLGNDRRAVVATVVDVEGSAYRRPGAKMVIEEGGEGTGAITAGCLEDEVLELTAEVLEAGEPRVETYDLMEDDDDVWGLGVGCNGVIDVLIEPLEESYRPALDALEAGERIGLVSVLSGPGAGATAYYRPDAGFEVAAGDPPGGLLESVEEAADRLVAAGKADTLTVETDDGPAEVFVDGLEPAPELVVFGSGHDVGPVVDLGRKAGFRVTVVSFRGAADLSERFPGADATRSTSPTNVRDAVDFDADTYAVVMTHNFIDDRLALEELLATETPYVGLMGPRERFEEMLEEFHAEGRTFDDAELDRLYTPIGLNLGAGSPYGIAQSIVAEVLAVHNGRDPVHLRDREGPIHDRVEVEAP